MNAEEVLKFTDALVFTKVGVHLNDLQRLLIESAWSGSRQCYEQIAKASGYSPNYLKQDAGPKLWQLLSNVFGEKVKKNTFKAAVERQAILASRTNLTNLTNLTILQPSINQHSVTNQYHDWGEAPDVSIFYGRTKEILTLEEWMTRDNCRVIGIMGIGGIGKTHLSVKFAEGIQSQFDFLIWRSLENEPSLEDILNSLLQSFTKQEEVDIPESVDKKTSLLLNYLRKYRCLVILDNLESILCSGEKIGSYKPGFEDYGNFFKRLGECRHRSCLIITSREKPKEVALMEGENSPVRCIHLRGLSASAGQQLLQSKGCYCPSEREYKYLVEQYSGNPLVLKIAAVAIKELFQGDIREFIQHKTLALDEIINLLEQQFNRLPNLAKAILYWLAIHREPVSIAQLLSEIHPPVSQQKIMETLKYLIQSSLIENNGNKFTLKRILMDYITTLLIEEVCEEIITGKLDILNSHALLKIENHGSMKKTQINFIVKPVIEKLVAVFKNQSDLGIHLKNIHSKIEEYHEDESGYASENIFNLICQIPNNLIGYSLYTYKFLQPQ